MSKPSEQVTISKDDLEKIIRDTVAETLTSIGLDTKNPKELQRDFATLRDWREAMQEVRTKSLITIVGILVTGLVAAVWIGIRSMMNSH